MTADFTTNIYDAALRSVSCTIPSCVHFNKNCLIASSVRYTECIQLMYSYFYAILHVDSSNRGPGSSVGIATGYGLNGPGIEFRWT